MATSRNRGRPALVLGAAALALCCAALGAVASMHGRAAAPLPDPSAGAAQAEGPAGEDPFPHVDWDYWLSVNADVVGWVTVPGTGIDQPVVRADPADPQFYLWHDVYRQWNYLGCPYVDADCAAGFDSPNCVVYGHNMGGEDQSMFGDFELFSDAEFAEAHSTVLLQTPDQRIELEVRCVDVVPGWEPANCTSFGERAGFLLWYEDLLADSAATMGERDAPDSVITFCTCSYGRWSNERTLVVTSRT